ncbi:hypothetical protein TRVA0_019S01486 [Trichomonascus vanleenenianus]|uniref:2-aminoadipate transaminase n=1 Tax=Trichomonascus vanleenenianus TaxID=2268995 RepID=UPI003ECB2ED7
MPYNLFKGHPTEDLLAREEILEGAQALLSPVTRPGDEDDEERHPLTYGSDPGAFSVRRAIAEWANRSHGEHAYGVPDPDCINLTNGASFGAQHALQQCTLPQTGYTRRAFIVSPTYFLINKVFEDAGFNDRLTAVPEDSEGIDVDYLQQQLEYYDELSKGVDDSGDVDRVLGRTEPPRKVFRYAMYCVPTFSNPRGSSIPLETRRRLVNLARKHDMLIICDDVYDLLDYRDERGEVVVKLPRLATVDRDTLREGDLGNVISNCTFSKLLGPGLRVGWIETATPYLAQQISQAGSTKSGGTPAHMNTMIVGELLKAGLVDKVISKLRTEFSKRSIAIEKALKKHMPHGTEVQGGSGGYFFWVTLPEGYNCTAIALRCREKGVVLAPEESFQVAGDERSSNRCFRVSLSYETAENAAEAIRIWGDVCRNV